MLDAPVSGGVLAAEAGTLTFMVWATSQQSPKGKKKIPLVWLWVLWYKLLPFAFFETVCGCFYYFEE